MAAWLVWFILRPAIQIQVRPDVDDTQYETRLTAPDKAPDKTPPVKTSHLTLNSWTGLTETWSELFSNVKRRFTHVLLTVGNFDRRGRGGVCPRKYNSIVQWLFYSTAFPMMMALVYGGWLTRFYKYIKNMTSCLAIYFITFGWQNNTKYLQC